MPVALTPDGVEISYSDLGGSGPPLLMVHATGFHGHIWAPVADRLQRDFHCFSLDLRGHGDSGVPAGLDFAWDGFAHDVKSVVDAVGLDHPRAVGHSLGGAISLMVEQRGPGTFHSIYVYEPAICVPWQEPAEDGSAEAIDLALRRRASFPSRQVALANYGGKPPMDSFADEALAAYVEFGFAAGGDGQVHLKCRPEYEAAIFGGFSNTSVYARLPEVRCPVVVACGSDLGSKAAERNDIFASRLPSSRAQQLSGLNHFGPQQSPAVVADSIRSTLGARQSAEPCGTTHRQ